jgi:MFS family permease
MNTTTTSQKKGFQTFTIIWLSQLVSMIGSGLIGFALAVWIFDQTGQATPFALTALFSSLPRVLLSPLAGALTDRWHRKKIMLIADSLSGLVTLATAFLLFTRQMEIWMVYVITATSSIFGVFQHPAYTASIVMLVPKEQLTRANSMIQLGEAIESLATPLLASILFGLIDMRGIIIIDLITYLIAIVTLILVIIPQPERSKEKVKEKSSLWEDVKFGWTYLVERQGLMGLLVYFALVNFLLNVSAILIGPMILSFGSPSNMGVAQSIMGAGLLIGSLLMSVWGGPKNKRIRLVIMAISLASIGFIVAGIKPSMLFIGLGLFILTFFIPFGSGPSSALFASKVAPNVQGRVFATRSMISQSMMPLAFLLSGVLADNVFNPLLVEGGGLAKTIIGNFLGVGPGRGIGLMMICSGVILLIVSGLAYANPHIRNIETEIPDAVLDEGEAEVGTNTVGEDKVALTT